MKSATQKNLNAMPTAKKMNLKTRLYRQRYLYIMLIPAIIWVILMCYLPMFGLYMAFTNYVPDGTPFFQSFFGSEFVGLQWIKYFIFDSGDLQGNEKYTCNKSFDNYILNSGTDNNSTCS